MFTENFLQLNLNFWLRHKVESHFNCYCFQRSNIHFPQTFLLPWKKARWNNGRKNYFTHFQAAIVRFQNSLLQLHATPRVILILHTATHPIFYADSWTTQQQDGGMGSSPAHVWMRCSVCRSLGNCVMSYKSKGHFLVSPLLMRVGSYMP